MASLVIVRRGRDIVGQCDALCYEAKGKICDCKACEGLNHGVGYDTALANTRRLHDQWASRAKADDPTTVTELAEDVHQHPLF